MAKKLTVFLILFIILAIALGGFIYFKSGVVSGEEIKTFEIDTVLIKSGIKQGEGIVKTIGIKNNDLAQNFKINSGLNVDISEEEFWLDMGESKTIELDFDVQTKSPGIYFGNLNIQGEIKNENIPIIFEIESKEVLFDSVLSVPVGYSKVYIGGELVVENKIFNLENIGSKNVNIEYFIKDFNGKAIFSDKENIAIESQVLNMKVFEMPENIEQGNYILGIIVSYSDSIGVSSHFFKVETMKKEFKIGENYFIWIILILILIIVLYNLYSSFKRDKYLRQLKKQYCQEVTKESGRVIREKQKIEGLKKSEKRKKLKEIIKHKKKRINIIKKIHKQRVKVVKKLHRQKKKSAVKRKLAEWEKQGYNVSEFLVNRKRNIKKSLKKDTAKFKKQGYKV